MPKPAHPPSPVFAHDRAWAQEGQLWVTRVADALGDLDFSVDHVGATAVPGLSAKNVIDIQALVLDFDPGTRAATCAAMQNAGFVLVDLDGLDPWRAGMSIDPQERARWLFNEPEGARRVHVAVRRFGAQNAAQALLLRDFLRDDDDARAIYDQHKQAVARHLRDNPVSYAALKGPVVDLLMRLAQAWAERNRWRPGREDG